jgi:hypothetical protein
LLVQSFNRLADEGSWLDFQAFGRMLGADIAEGSLSMARTSTSVPLLLGWVTSVPASDETLASVA